MTKSEKVEWIPAHLEYEGPAKVEEYFDSRIIPGENGKFIGFFRGHELVGKNFEVPENYEVSLVAPQDETLQKLAAVSNLRIWDLDEQSLENSLQFTDVITVGNILMTD